MLIPEETCQVILRVLEEAPCPDMTVERLAEILREKIQERPQLAPRNLANNVAEKTLVAALRLLDDRGLVAPATDFDAKVGFVGVILFDHGELCGGTIRVRITWAGHCVLQAHREQQGETDRAAA